MKTVEDITGFRPQQGLTIMNIDLNYDIYLMLAEGFPSPTGVNYYELKTIRNSITKVVLSFRPQQGLTIMNVSEFSIDSEFDIGFPSPTGVNYYEYELKDKQGEKNYVGFRPQQGLTIMNRKGRPPRRKDYDKVSVPNRG